MSKQKKKPRFYQRPLWATFLITGVVIIVLAGVFVGRLIALSGSGTLEYAASPESIIAPPTKTVGETLDFFTWIRNDSSDPIVLQSVTVDNGSPAQVSLLHVSLVTLSDATCCEYNADTQWPPAVRLGHAFALQPISGFVLAPQSDVGVVFAVHANDTGTFVTGPITVRGVIQAFPGSGEIGLSVSRIYYTYGILCYAGQDRCNQQVQSVQRSLAP